jgi:DNA polymerase-4
MIIFVHVPGFYAAVEAVDHPGDGRPIIVGGDPGKGGTVTSASPEARAAGVLEGMELPAAQQLCAGADLRPTRLRRYREVAAELRAILRTVSERIEPEGLDSTYLECPAEADPVTLAAKLCVGIQAELGLRAVAGLGATRFVAHLAGRTAGPTGIREVKPERAQAFLAEFGVTEIWGLGPATAEKLIQAGLETIGDLQKLPLVELEAVVGARNAATFLELARAEDRSTLRPAPPVKSLSREITLETPTGDLRSLGDAIGGLATRLEEMLQRERRAARTVTLGLTFVDGERVSRTQTLDRPVVRSPEIGEVGLQLLSRTQAGVRRVRRLRLQLSSLSRPEAREEPQQLRLF